MTQSSDWRLRGQENYLAGVTLVRRAYRRYAANPKWDHDHCAFCSAKFMVEDYLGVLHEGHATLDDYHWICERCFQDFHEQFQWTVVDDNTQQTNWPRNLMDEKKLISPIDDSKGTLEK